MNMGSENSSVISTYSPTSSNNHQLPWIDIDTVTTSSRSTSPTVSEVAKECNKILRIDINDTGEGIAGPILHKGKKGDIINRKIFMRQPDIFLQIQEIGVVKML